MLIQKPYKIPNAFLSWKVFQKHLEMLQLISPKKINIYGYPSVMENLSFLYNTWAEGYPLYCVRETLLDEILKTEVGEKIELFDEINLSVPCYALFFPKNKVKSPTKGFLDYLIVYHEEINYPEYKHFIAWGGIDSSESTVFGYKRIRNDGTLQRSHFTTEDKEQQDQALQIRNIVLQSILLLQYYPEFSEQMLEVRCEPKGFGNRVNPKESEYQLPRWLGQERKTSINVGTGTAKNKHYRRGHWRSLPSGEGKTWVRPTWVNVFKDA